MNPGFLSLFRKGRYSGIRAGLEDEDRGHSQCEAFAVAAVAFALKHDVDFARGFLKGICGEDLDPRELILEIEPDKSSDLRFRTRDGSRLFVIEFKIHAPLEPHQDPTNHEAFWNDTAERKIGYGARVTAWRKELPRAELTYVVLQKERLHSPIQERNGLKCISREWREIARAIPVRSPLCEDLFRCLNEFGLPWFTTHRIMKTKLGDVAKSAVETYQLLEKVAESVGEEFEVQCNETAPGDDAGWWNFGFYTPGRFSPSLKAAVQPEKEQKVIWFGYQGIPSSGVGVEVWLAVHLLCGNADAARGAMNDLRRVGLVPVQRPEEDNSVILRTSADDPKRASDAEWFIDTLDALKGCKFS